MKIGHKISFALAIAVIGISACKKEKNDPVVPNEEELITTVIYTLIDTVSSDTIELSIQDIDGNGGNPPVINTENLNPNSVYWGHITLLNESVDPAIDISEEVYEEGEEHQFFYVIESSLSTTISYDDEDVNGNPIGLRTILQTGNSTAGELIIILRHNPDKYAPGVAEGDIINAGGETDVEVNFDIVVE